MILVDDLHTCTGIVVEQRGRLLMPLSVCHKANIFMTDKTREIRCNACNDVLLKILGKEFPSYTELDLYVDSPKIIINHLAFWLGIPKEELDVNVEW